MRKAETLRPHEVHTKHARNWGESSHHRRISPTQELVWFDEMSRLIGGFLDHSRAALNYLAYQLALLALREEPSLEKLRPDQVEFPIFSSRDLFQANHRIKHFPGKYRGALDAVQPYDGCNRGLWLLHELAREHRHRNIQPACVWPADDRHRVFVNGRPVPAHDVSVEIRDRPLVDGDLLFRFRIDPPVEGERLVHTEGVVFISLDHPLCRGQEAIAVVNDISRDANMVVNRFERDWFQ